MLRSGNTARLRTRGALERCVTVVHRPEAQATVSAAASAIDPIRAYLAPRRGSGAGTGAGVAVSSSSEVVRSASRAPAVAGRPAGSGDRARSTTLTNAAGRSGRTSRRVWRRPEACACLMSLSVTPDTGNEPDTR